jgi:hypothetical protein
MLIYGGVMKRDPHQVRDEILLNSHHQMYFILKG